MLFCKDVWLSCVINAYLFTYLLTVRRFCSATPEAALHACAIDQPRATPTPSVKVVTLMRQRWLQGQLTNETTLQSLSKGRFDVSSWRRSKGHPSRWRETKEKVLRRMASRTKPMSGVESGVQMSELTQLPAFIQSAWNAVINWALARGRLTPRGSSAWSMTPYFEVSSLRSITGFHVGDNTQWTHCLRSGCAVRWLDVRNTLSTDRVKRYSTKKRKST